MKRREALRSGILGAASVIGIRSVVGSASAQTTLTFDSTDFDNAVGESGVVHQSTANTDHTDASVLKQGYDYENFGHITPTPVSCYPLHEDSGSTANDLAGTNDGTVTGATVGATGVLGTTAYDFDGVDDYIKIADANTLDLSNWTLATWINADEWDATATSVFSKRAASADDNYFLEVASDGSEIKVGFGDGSSYYVATFSNTFSTNTWYHIAGSWDGSVQSAFVNGVKLGEVSQSKTPSQNTAPVNIGGQNSNENDFYHNGRLNDCRIYDTALAESEITDLYNVVDTAGELLTGPKTS